MKKLLSVLLTFSLLAGNIISATAATSAVTTYRNGEYIQFDYDKIIMTNSRGEKMYCVFDALTGVIEYLDMDIDASQPCEIYIPETINNIEVKAVKNDALQELYSDISGGVWDTQIQQSKIYVPDSVKICNEYAQYDDNGQVTARKIEYDGTSFFCGYVVYNDEDFTVCCTENSYVYKQHQATINAPDFSDALGITQYEIINNMPKVTMTSNIDWSEYANYMAEKLGYTAEQVPSTPVPAEETEPIENKYIYDEKDPGENLTVDTDRLDGIETSDDAAKAVEDAVKGADTDAKKSATGTDVLTIYAEEAAAKAGEMTITDSKIVINDQLVSSAAESVNEAIGKIDTTLKTNDVTPQRKYRRKVRINVPQNQGITIEKQSLSADIEAVELVTDFAVVNLNANSDETVAVENTAANKVKVEFDTSRTSRLNVSFPNKSSDTKYFAVVDENGNAVGGKYNPVQNTLEAKLNESGVYSVINNEKDFDDIKSKNVEMQKAIKVLASKGIISGTSATEFSPDNSISRAEVAALVVRTLSQLDVNEDGGFSDVTRENWYFGAAGSSKRYGIINGYEDNTFRGEVVIPKDQILIVAARVLKNEMGYYVPNNVNSYLPYADSAEIADWAREDLALATAANLVVKRTDGKFVGAEDMTRGDAAIVLYRMFMKIW